MRKFSIAAAALAFALTMTACSSTENESAPNSSGAAQNLNSGVSEQKSNDSGNAEMVYGTATLSYAEFFSGDVSETSGFDAVSSATVSKYEIMPNMATDFVDETTNADGYHITGVKNVNVAVPAADIDAFTAVNPSFAKSDETPAQYKTVSMQDGKAVYSATNFNVADTVKDAAAELQTGSTWGDYQINVTDGATVHLRNSREDEFDINSQIQGMILETSSGLKVGMEHLQSIWVQPYEVSFNVLDDNTHNVHIAQYDNLSELSKLVGETVTKITYIMPNDAYIYEFDGIYIKPIYKKESITAALSDNKISLSNIDYSDFENGKLTVTYTLGSGRERDVTTLLETDLSENFDNALDISAIADKEKSGVYSAVISSDNYADINVAIPAQSAQTDELNALLETARTKLSSDPENTTLSEHIKEAEELLAKENVSSSEIGEIFSELTELTAENSDSGRSH